MDDASAEHLMAVVEVQRSPEWCPLFFGRALVIEPRYLDAAVDQLRADGFEVELP